MKYLFVLVLLAVPVHSSFAQLTPAKKECRCHSKQPAMKHMHEVIGFSGCGNCHSKGENLMSGRQADPEKNSKLAERFAKDRNCAPCHDSRGSVRKAALSDHKAQAISGTLYCPKDKVRFGASTKSCPTCGGSLINISQVMETSRKNPSNEICIGCHSMEEVRQIDRHRIFNSVKLAKCLDCHQGHDDCGSCHH